MRSARLSDGTARMPRGAQRGRPRHGRKGHLSIVARRSNRGDEGGDSTYHVSKTPNTCLAMKLAILAAVLLLASLLGAMPACAEDRKSTRLNSSHLGISYAVFCL